MTFGMDPDPRARTSDYNGSISEDPYLGRTVPALDPAIFVIDLQDVNKVFAYYCLKVDLHHFSKVKSQSRKKSQNNRNQGFSYYFCLMIEVTGFVSLTNGSGSGRPKNIQIRNTESIYSSLHLLLL
jgi:hypothetical protein